MSLAASLNSLKSMIGQGKRHLTIADSTNNPFLGFIQHRSVASGFFFSFCNVFSDGGNDFGKKARGFIGMEQNITMEVAQLLLSLLHAWGIDMDLDKVCEGKLGLLRPMLPVSFGVLSKGGEFFSLVLPLPVIN